MISLSDWFPPLAAGLTFTSLGICKIVGWIRNVIGGGGKPVLCRLQGRRPSWSKEFNFAFMLLLLAVGFLNLGLFAFVCLKP